MILYVKGDMFQSPAQVLVNTVNTVGVMGKGIALDFKRMFPEMFVEYRKLCESGQFDVGTLWLYKTPNKWILNFPTKKHWRQPSRVEYVEEGLKEFAATYLMMDIPSIASPPLECGNGQLDFQTQVQPLMEKYLRNLPIEIFIYPNRESDFIEHLNPNEMKYWLPSERLPNSFETLARKSNSTAHMFDNPPHIQVLAAKQKYNIPFDALMSFWQQLRSHGFSMRHIAPGLDRHISYLIPIFAELEYISPVQVADQYDTLQASGIIGLQVLPPAFDKLSQNTLEFEQLSPL